MHIAIEGLDGVGKTSTAKELAKQIKGVYFSKAFHLMRDTSGVYDNFTSIVECGGTDSRNYSSYGTRSSFLYSKLMGYNVVTERYFCTNYAVKPDTQTLDEIRLNINYFGYPDITFILYCDPKTNYQRMYDRNPYDKDFEKLKEHKAFYEKLLKAAKIIGLRYYFLDTTNLTLLQVVNSLLNIINDKSNLNVECLSQNSSWYVQGSRLYIKDNHDISLQDFSRNIDLSNIDQLFIPKSINHIPPALFEFLPNIKRINVDSENQYYMSCNGVLFSKDGNRLLRVPVSYDSDTYIVPQNVLQVGYNAFKNCHIKYIEINDNCREIGYISFWGCAELKRISIGNRLKKIGRMAFLGCTALTIIDTNTTALTFKNGILLNDKGDIVSSFGSHSELINNTKVNAWAFAGNKRINDLKLGENVKRIGPYAFVDSTIESLIINSPIEIHDYAFWNCKKLNFIVFRSRNISRIAHELFYNIGHDVKICVPKGTSDMYKISFKNCNDGITIEEMEM